MTTVKIVKRFKQLINACQGTVKQLLIFLSNWLQFDFINEQILHKNRVKVLFLKVLEFSEVWKTSKSRWSNFEETSKKIVTQIQNILTHYIILKVLLTSNENDA